MLLQSSLAYADTKVQDALYAGKLLYDPSPYPKSQAVANVEALLNNASDAERAFYEWLGFGMETVGETYVSITNPAIGTANSIADIGRIAREYLENGGDPDELYFELAKKGYEDLLGSIIFDIEFEKLNKSDLPTLDN